MNNKKFITLWGVLDLSAFGWYVGWQIFHGKIPFYHDILKSIQLNKTLSIPSLNIVTIISITLHVSLLFSGYYLIKTNKIGAILSYFQAPFRILTLIPPSLFFIFWPLKFIFDTDAVKRNISASIFDLETITALAVVTIMLLLSEVLKLYSILTWRKKVKTHNQVL